MLALKYVILAPRTGHGLRLIRFGLAPDSHRDLAAALTATHYASSAGFVEFPADGSVHTYGLSESLRMGPMDEDANLIAAHARATHRLSTVL